MNEKFSTPHPSFLEFIHVIEEESHDQVERLANIRNGKAKPPKYGDKSDIGSVPLV